MHVVCVSLDFNTQHATRFRGGRGGHYPGTRIFAAGAYTTTCY